MRLKHPERKAFFKAIRTGKVPFRKHLEQCDSCRQLFELLSICDRHDQSQTTQPTSNSLYRSRAIALLDSSNRTDQILQGELAHDSWAGLPAQQVRDAAYSGERRLRFKVGEIILELVIEKTAGEFEMVGRVYENGSPSTKYILQIGQKKLYTKNHMCFYWNSKKPPRRIQLLSAGTKFEFGTLAW